jgi:hypothetical protein
MKKVVCCNLVILLIVLTAVSSYAQYDQYGRWVNQFTEEPIYFEAPNYTPREAITFLTKWRLIEEENAIKTLNEWAGDYSIYSELGGAKVLRWSPQAGFVFFIGGGCEPSVRGINYGKVAFTKNMLQLFPEIQSEDPSLVDKKILDEDVERLLKTRNFVTDKFVPVKWHGVHWLIPEKQIADFYDYVAGVGRHRPTLIGWEGGTFLSKKDGHREDENETPSLPPGYERFVKKPLDATIISVGRRFLRHIEEEGEEYGDEWVTPVVLNVGSEQGVQKDMVFSVLLSNVSDVIEITKIGKRSSKAEIAHRVSDDNASSIKVGVKVSTAMWKKWWSEDK